MLTLVRIKNTPNTLPGFCNNTTKPTLFKSDQRFKSGYNIWIMYN